MLWFLVTTILYTILICYPVGFDRGRADLNIACSTQNLVFICVCVFVFFSQKTLECVRDAKISAEIRWYVGYAEYVRIR